MIGAGVRGTLRVLAFLLCLCVFAAYLAPEWLALFKTWPYAYQNGWDEYVYLSWQGALGARNIPGYFPLYLVVALHKLGMSGAIQNLIFDTLLPPLTAYFVFRSLRMIGVDRHHAWPYSVIICFASVLFNYSNPLLTEHISKYDSAPTFMAGWENYPSILRTPSPEVSYLLIAAAVFAFLKYRRKWILLTPLPLLYYYVAVPYCILLGGAMLATLTNAIAMRPAIRIALSSLVAFALAGIVAGILSHHMGDYAAALRNSAATYLETRKFQWPIAALACGGFFVVIKIGRIADRDARLTHWMIWLLAAMFATGNLQLITGVMISQKNYYDYGISALAGVACALALQTIANDLVKTLATVVVLAAIAYLTTNSQLFWYDYSAQLAQKAEPITDEVRKDPQHAVVSNWMVSSIIAYATPRMVAPPLSFQNVYPFVERQCDLNPQLVDGALAFARARLGAEDPAFKSLRDMREMGRRFSELAKAQPYKNRAYCESARYQPSNFFLRSIGVGP